MISSKPGTRTTADPRLSFPLDREALFPSNRSAMLHLYDTRTRTAQDISPMDGKTLRFYCCGPTVYGPAHIGNFRTFVMQDVFRRVLELGVPTTHIRNLTDVDDKTIRDSQKAGVSLAEFTVGWADLFHRDCAALNCLASPCGTLCRGPYSRTNTDGSNTGGKGPCLCIGRRFRVFQNFFLPGIRKAFPPGRT